MTNVGVPVAGLNTVDQIVPTNDLVFHVGQNGLAIAVALLSTHTAGAPVVDRKGMYLGFINEFDLMRALNAGKDLGALSAEEIMRTDRLVIAGSTKIAEASKMMETHHVLSLPVEKDGVILYSVTRHDLLRAWIGLGVGMGLDA
jgi:predicted transcriptional regulator